MTIPEGYTYSSDARVVASDIGWRDITAQVTTRGVGATDPAWTQIGSGPFYAYSFALNDVAWFTYHIPHDIVRDAPIHLHAHWMSDGTNANSVKWEWYYTFAQGFDQENFDSTGTLIEAEEAISESPITAYRHMVTETAAITIPGLDEPDGLLQVRIRRVTNGATDNTDEIFLLESDVHYLSNSLATPYKSPNFYDR